MSNVDELYQELPSRIAPYVFSDEVETPIRKAKFGDSSGCAGPPGCGRSRVRICPEHG